MAPIFSRLVRFEDKNGDIHYGEADADWKRNLVGQIVPTYVVTNVFDNDYTLTGKSVEISKVSQIFERARYASYAV